MEDEKLKATKKAMGLLQHMDRTEWELRSKLEQAGFSEEAVEAARQNAALNGLSNCRFIAGDVLKVLDDLKVKPDMIVLDPPREGIHPKALPKILSYGVKRIVYVSCKATSLARDMETCCVDQFCQTVWTEAVAVFVRE